MVVEWKVWGGPELYKIIDGDNIILLYINDVLYGGNGVMEITQDAC